MDSTAAEAPPTSQVELEVRRVRELLKSHQHAEALRAAEALAVEVPENRDVLHLIAMSQRYLGRIPEAGQELGRAVEMDPADEENWRTLGVLLTQHLQFDQAVDLFRRATARFMSTTMNDDQDRTTRSAVGQADEPVVE